MGFSTPNVSFEYSAKWKSQSLIKMPWSNCDAFTSEFSVLGVVHNGKLRVEKPRKNISEVSENSESRTSEMLEFVFFCYQTLISSELSIINV